MARRIVRTGKNRATAMVRARRAGHSALDAPFIRGGGVLVRGGATRTWI